MRRQQSPDPFPRGVGEVDHHGRRGRRVIPRNYVAGSARPVAMLSDRQWPSDPWADAAAAGLDRGAAGARAAGWGYHELPTRHDGAMTTELHILADLLLTLVPAILAIPSPTVAASSA